MKSCF
ncbi:Protein of unknown function [Lactobacillus delbrueckii subsp. lactis]